MAGVGTVFEVVVTGGVCPLHLVPAILLVFAPFSSKRFRPVLWTRCALYVAIAMHSLGGDDCHSEEGTRDHLLCVFFSAARAKVDVLVVVVLVSFFICFLRSDHRPPKTTPETVCFVLLCLSFSGSPSFFSFLAFTDFVLGGDGSAILGAASFFFSSTRHAHGTPYHDHLDLDH